VVLSDYYDLGFDLRSRVLVFGFKDGKKTVTQTHGNLVAHLCAHERGETRGGFAHQHSRVLAFDIDSAQLELTQIQKQNTLRQNTTFQNCRILPQKLKKPQQYMKP